MKCPVCKREIKQSERSLSQLGLYWLWLKDVAEETGNDENALHELLLEKCAPKVVVKVKGRKQTYEMEKSKRTSGGHALSMKKGEMSEYMEKCAQFTGCPLPTKSEIEAMGYTANY